MFEQIPQEQWLTATEVHSRLDKVSFSRVKEVLVALRREYESLPESERPYRQVGRSFLYHPEFVKLVDSREKTRGVKPKKSNQT